MALQTPGQQTSLIDSVWEAILSEHGEYETEVQEHADPDVVFADFKKRLESMGFRLALSETEPTSLPGRAATG